MALSDIIISFDNSHVDGAAPCVWRWDLSASVTALAPLAFSFTKHLVFRRRGEDDHHELCHLSAL